jgi:hypothetical protein
MTKDYNSEEKDLRNTFAKYPVVGTHLPTDQWFAKKLKGRFFEDAIDLACNNGYGYSIYGAPFARKSTFVDFADKCLEEAMRRYGHGSTFICTDLTREWPALPIFDLVCLVQFIQHIPDIKVAEKIFGKAAELVGDTMLFSHYASFKEIEEGEFAGGLYYRKCSLSYLTALISKNGLRVVHSQKVLSDYNFILCRK